MTPKYISAYRHYWDEITKAISCIHTYVAIIEGDLENVDLIDKPCYDSCYDDHADYLRYVVFGQTVSRARRIYYEYCHKRNEEVPSFGLRDEHALDDFFHELLMDRERLFECDYRAMLGYNHSLEPVPLDILIEI